ncbi:hypothetical protein BDZ89DRAFT_1063886 [Hymenopellis radicata]|nr:hypothetical protein BDZ89DRAFT_1063886 [Hymenopellis radicata]
MSSESPPSSTECQSNPDSPSPPAMSGLAPSFYEHDFSAQQYHEMQSTEHYNQWSTSYSQPSTCLAVPVDGMAGYSQPYVQDYVAQPPVAYENAYADQFYQGREGDVPLAPPPSAEITAVRPMAGGRVPTRRLESNEDAHTTVRPRTSRLPGACNHCRRLKMRCDFGDNPHACKRCLQGGQNCVIEERKKTRTPNKREHLLAQLREKDAIIESLLKHIYLKSYEGQGAVLPVTLQ